MIRLILLASVSFALLGVLALGVPDGQIGRFNSAPFIFGLIVITAWTILLDRIAPPMMNVLGPIGERAPFRRQAGALRLFLTLIILVGLYCRWSDQMLGYILIALGASFMSRAGDFFIGRFFFHPAPCFFAFYNIAAGGVFLLLGVKVL